MGDKGKTSEKKDSFVFGASVRGVPQYLLITWARQWILTLTISIETLSCVRCSHRQGANLRECITPSRCDRALSEIKLSPVTGIAEEKHTKLFCLGDDIHGIKWCEFLSK